MITNFDAMLRNKIVKNNFFAAIEAMLSIIIKTCSYCTLKPIQGSGVKQCREGHSTFDPAWHGRKHLANSNVLHLDTPHVNG